MISAAVSQVKARLSELLARVKAGEELYITERGRPVAKIVPLKGDPEARLPELERAGLVRQGSGRLSASFWQHLRPSDPSGAAVRALLQEREEDA